MVAAQPQPTPDPRRLLGQVLVGRYRVHEFIGERGVSAVTTSVDLWTHYGTFKIQTCHDDDALRM